MDISTSNIVSLHPGGYIEVLVKGPQSYLSFDLIKRDVQQLTNKLQFENKPVLGLVDLTEMTGFNTGSNKAALEILEAVPYTKVALFGGNSAISTVTDLVIQAIGKGDRTRLFKDKESALAWLLAT
jgi:hypothetical protein